MKTLPFHIGSPVVIDPTCLSSAFSGTRVSSLPRFVWFYSYCVLLISCSRHSKSSMLSFRCALKLSCLFSPVLLVRDSLSIDFCIQHLEVKNKAKPVRRCKTRWYAISRWLGSSQRKLRRGYVCLFGIFSFSYHEEMFSNLCSPFLFLPLSL